MAYVVAAGEAREWRAYLKERVPEYMIPVFVAIEEMPMTVSGKIDRQALVALGVGEDGAAYEAPRNALEESLVEIWQQVLGVERVGINDNFFELGGHSLLATQVLARLGQATGVELAATALWDTPTVATLALKVADGAAGAGAGNGDAIIPP